MSNPEDDLFKFDPSKVPTNLQEIKDELMKLIGANKLDCTAGKPEEVAIAFFKDGSTIMLTMPDLDVDPDTIEGLDKIKEEELKLWQPLQDLPQEKQDQFDMVVRYSKTGKHMHDIPKVEEIMKEIEALKTEIREHQDQKESQDQADFHFDQMTSIDVTDEPTKPVKK